MFRHKRLHASFVVAIILILSFTSSSFAQEEKKKKKQKPAPKGTPVLWVEPTDLESRDLLLGPGGEAMKPDLRKVTFIKQEEGGWSKKFRVRDGSNHEWVAKLGRESQSETAAVRLVWAIGYHTEINYLVPCVRIEGAPKPDKKDETCEGGGFANVRFEARPKYVERLDPWTWKENPFVGTKELQGLIVMMALLNNWDIKDENNKIFQVRSDQTGQYEARYVISDLGATFGKTGGGAPLVWRLTRSRNNPEDYRKSSFIEDVKGENVFFYYGGKAQDLFDDIRVEEAKWLGTLLARLSEQQIGDAFRAANYTPAEVSILTDAVRARTRELVELPSRARMVGQQQ
ncbi:MAG TPA: hypothetical protein VF666_16495 [Pyrinomonadaceae bacterium]|jgi:hypothetical protein